ncbi:hypothetical protein V6N12_047224 [Hibiscus sabdariffa]|uniref:Uncharacterized protein n=1 Tax=Hibiscus sabdariffa TaxID=183260 RepID=A0ABR2DA91_9ROSI
MHVYKEEKQGKDDVLGPYKKHVASFEENSCYTEFDSFELLEEGHQNDGDKELLTRETNSSDGEDVSFSTENGITLLTPVRSERDPKSFCQLSSELVQANPNGKRGFNQLKNPSPTPGSFNRINNLLLPRSMDDHSMMKRKHFIESALPHYQLSLFPAQQHIKNNATVYSLARLGATELQCHRKDDHFTNSERRCNRFNGLMDSDINLMNISYSGCRQYDQFRNLKEKDMSHAMESLEKMFLNHVEHVQPSCCRESSKILIPWLIQATQQVQAPNTPQLFPEVGGKYPHTARTSFLINHLVPRFPIVSYDHSSMISCSRMESSVAPFIPSLPVIKPTSVNLSQRNGMKSKIVSTQDLVISQKARKRPAVEEDYLMKSTKVRNLGIRDESRATKPFLNSAQFISHIITQ